MGAAEVPMEATVARAAVITPYLAAKKRLPEGPPAKEHFTTVHPYHLPASHVERIRLTAQFTAVGGREFLNSLAEREVDNPHYDFLKPTNGMFSYFTTMVEQYNKVLKPPPPVRERVAQVAQSPFSAFVRVVHRVEWARAEQEREALEGGVGGGGVAPVDWHDFEVVETIPLEEVGAVSASATAAANYEGLGVSTAGNGDGHASGSDDMEMSDEETEGASAAHTSGASAAAAGGTAGASNAAAAAIHTYDDDDETLNVQANYVPVIPAPGAKLTHFVDPQSGQEVPIDSISEHMRIALLDPKWREETARALDKQRKSLFASGEDVNENLRRLAARRADVFGANAVSARAAVGNTTAGREHVGATWDGDLATADAMTQARAAAAAGGQIKSAAPRGEVSAEGPELPPSSKRPRTQE